MPGECGSKSDNSNDEWRGIKSMLHPFENPFKSPPIFDFDMEKSWFPSERQLKFMLLGGYLLDKVYGLHSLIGSFSTLAEAQAAAAAFRFDGKWYQIVNLDSLSIVESWPV